ncbi:MAG: transcriptional repressor [Desulfobacterales bacterium]|nr:transcriptional repressor [Desulfobacterales bacterium]
MLETQNLRMTRQRQVILEELRKVKTHPSADELYEKVKRRLPRISLGTVYRNLEILTRLGEIQHVEIGGGMKRFDGNTHNHYHIRCARCARIDDVHIDPLKQVEDALDGYTDYQITGHRLEFVGLCRKCSKKSV